MCSTQRQRGQVGSKIIMLPPISRIRLLILEQFQVIKNQLESPHLVKLLKMHLPLQRMLEVANQLRKIILSKLAQIILMEVSAKEDNKVSLSLHLRTISRLLLLANPDALKTKIMLL